MKIEKVKVSAIKSNPKNPRLIKDDKFFKLVKSVKEFPQMLELRPIVVNEDMIVLGGNMRLKACIEAGYKEVTIVKAKDLTPEQQNEFIIKDNVGFGEWDWDMLANEWNSEDLTEWGLDVWQQSAEIDYSILDEENNIDEQLNQMNDGVKKAIMIEFHIDNYSNAFELVKFWRERKMDIGLFLIEKLTEEKKKL